MTESIRADANTAVPRTRWFWGPLAVIGIAVLFFGGWRAMQVLTCPGWPVTNGTITKSDMARGMLREGVAAPKAAVAYAYRVDGVDYTGNRISFDRIYGPYQNANAVLRQFRKDMPVRVHYNPAAPGESALDVTVTWHGFRLLLTGLVLAPLGIIGYRKRWPLQSEGLMDGPSGQEPLTGGQKILGFLGLVAIIAIALLWWELIKQYAGVD